MTVLHVFFWNPRRATDTNTVELTADEISLYMHIEHLTSADCTQVAAVQTQKLVKT